jgi:hypothetical protein
VLRQIEPDTRDRRHMSDRLAVDGFPSDASMTTTHLGMLMTIRGTMMVVPKGMGHAVGSPSAKGKGWRIWRVGHSFSARSSRCSLCSLRAATSLSPMGLAIRASEWAMGTTMDGPAGTAGMDTATAGPAITAAMAGAAVIGEADIGEADTAGEAAPFIIIRPARTPDLPEATSVAPLSAHLRRTLMGT